MTINERILALRRAAGLSQEALAEQVGVSRQAIGKWESGASLPGLDNLQELARALGVSCDELLTGKESGTENTAGQDGVALESVKALLDAQMRRRPMRPTASASFLRALPPRSPAWVRRWCTSVCITGAACGSFPAVWTTSAQTWPASKAASICVSHPSSPA